MTCSHVFLKWSGVASRDVNITVVATVALLALWGCSEDDDKPVGVSKACNMLTEVNDFTRDALAGERDVNETHAPLVKFGTYVADNDISEDDMRKQCAAEVEQFDDLDTIVNGID